MAVPKPLRALAIVSAFLFLYLVFQVLKSLPTIHGPGDLEQGIPNEPTLKGKANPAPLFNCLSNSKQILENQMAPCGEQTNMRRTTPMPLV